ncbi:MAG: glutaminyl-peptide cyclotransferase [Pseudomonadota bacterium]
MKYFSLLLCLSLSSIANAEIATKPSAAPVARLDYQIIGERTHKPSLFTQGLVIKDGYFYESSGLYAKSILVSYPVTEPETTWAKLSAPFTRKQKVPDRYFAEGLTLLHNKLYQLTWQEGVLFIIDATTFTLLNTVNYKGEGWGLTTDGKYLIRSDGSATLFFHNENDFAVEKKIDVSLNHEPVNNLNELEYGDGFIWANIWHDNRIVKINPINGDVVGIVDLSSIVKTLGLYDSESVLNGIAYDVDRKAFWVTGKQWPKMFLLKIN